MRAEIEGPAGKLVAELEEPSGAPRAAAIVCHPHPLHGGSLRNAIVVRAARALRSAGLVTLRFNFRGVEGSEGVHHGDVEHGAGEVEDAAAAATELAARHPGLALWAAGYSFGARIVAELAAGDERVQRLVLVAFPVRLFDASVLARARQPGLVVMGAADPFGTAADLRERTPLPPDLEIVEIAGADHFFRGRTPLVEEAVLRYARAALDPALP